MGEVDKVGLFGNPKLTSFMDISHFSSCLTFSKLFSFSLSDRLSIKRQSIYYLAFQVLLLSAPLLYYLASCSKICLICLHLQTLIMIKIHLALT